MNDLFSKSRILLVDLELKKSRCNDNEEIGRLSSQIKMLQACLDQSFASWKLDGDKDWRKSPLRYDHYIAEWGEL